MGFVGITGWGACTCTAAPGGGGGGGGGGVVGMFA
jgi:hypothetical protein